MTREAAKNNRVMTSRAHPTVQEKPSVPPPAPKPSSTATKSGVKRRWWCFGSSATDSDVEDPSHHNEKHVALSRTSSRLSTASGVASVEESDEDEDEWDEARAVGSGLLRFGCARKQRQRQQYSNSNGARGEQRNGRQRATLKKRAA
jgi:hypothetical protein